MKLPPEIYWSTVWLSSPTRSRTHRSRRSSWRTTRRRSWPTSSPTCSWRVQILRSSVSNWSSYSTRSSRVSSTTRSTTVSLCRDCSDTSTRAPTTTTSSTPAKYVHSSWLSSRTCWIPCAPRFRRFRTSQPYACPLTSSTDSHLKVFLKTYFFQTGRLNTWVWNSN